MPSASARSTTAICYGLVAPLFEQGKVLAATITGNKGPTYTGTVQAAKLKIMGVDVFSAGEWADGTGVEPVRYEDPALGVYKKLALRDGKLAGVILVGDAGDSHRYMDWLRSSADLTAQRRQLLFPPPSSDAGLDVAEMAESATVCGCVGVTKGTIIRAIHDNGVNTLSQLKESDARQHRVWQLHGPVPGPAARRRAGVRGRGQEGDLRLPAVRRGPAARDSAQRRGSSRCRKCSRSTATAAAARCASRR